MKAFKNRDLLTVLAALVALVTIASVTSKAESDQKKAPKQDVVALPTDWLDTTPVRGGPRGLIYNRNEFSYRCNECHEDLKASRGAGPSEAEHKELILSHGENQTCLSCHHYLKREAFIDNDGSEISSSEPVRLCQKCHGPVYRDWKWGIHGRLNGYWSPAYGKQEKLACNQCHDPHWPAFKKMVPFPPPAVSRLHSSRDTVAHE